MTCLGCTSESAIGWHWAQHWSHCDKELSAMGHSEVTMETLISQEHSGIWNEISKRFVTRHHVSYRTMDHFHRLWWHHYIFIFKYKLYFFYNLGMKLQKCGYYCRVSVSNKRLWVMFLLYIYIYIYMYSLLLEQMEPRTNMNDINQ